MKQPLIENTHNLRRFSIFDYVAYGICFFCEMRGLYGRLVDLDTGVLTGPAIVTRPLAV